MYFFFRFHPSELTLFLSLHGCVSVCLCCDVQLVQWPQNVFGHFKSTQNSIHRPFNFHNVMHFERREKKNKVGFHFMHQKVIEL